MGSVYIGYASASCNNPRPQQDQQLKHHAKLLQFTAVPFAKTRTKQRAHALPASDLISFLNIKNIYHNTTIHKA